MQAHLRTHGRQALAQEVGFPHPGFDGRERMLGVSRRTAVALPIASMRAASASRTASCSQRRTRRSCPVVHRCFNGQPVEAAVL
jgi:hypothetical protein